MTEYFVAWFTKSNKPKDDYVIMRGTKVHYCYVDGKETLCGIKITGSRWFVSNKNSKVLDVTCQWCIKKVATENNKDG